MNRINSLESDPNLSNYSNLNLLTLKDYYRRNREISYLFLTLTYILNIVDASVDAHLFNYEINDDISLEIFPSNNSYMNSNGLILSFKFCQILYFFGTQR